MNTTASPSTMYCPQCSAQRRVSEPFAFASMDRLRSTLACGHVVVRPTAPLAFDPADVCNPDWLHTVTITDTDRHGYPFRAVCECGWESRPYAARHAAQSMADAHLEETVR